MINITRRILQYRECSRQLCNNYFRHVEWKIGQLKTTENDFRRMSFFDWTSEKIMELQYARVRLIHSEEFPELVGYDFLPENLNSEFYTG